MSHNRLDQLADRQRQHGLLHWLAAAALVAIVALPTLAFTQQISTMADGLMLRTATSVPADAQRPATSTNCKNSQTAS